MRITIKDVAKEAQVSPATVSRVMSKNKRISEKTRLKVEAAIEKLNYKPDLLARRLVTKKSRVLGIVIPKEAKTFFQNPFFTQVMMGMSIRAKEDNYYIMYAFGKNEEEELKIVDDFSTNNFIEGICLLTARENDKTIKTLKDKKFPFVVIGNPDDDNILWVDNDNKKATFNIVNMLIEKGHKKIGFIGARGDLQFSKKRLEGYKEALIKNNIDIDESIIVEMEDFDEKCGYNGIEKIMNKDISVVLTSEDLLAVGANKYLYIQGINHIRVIGFNNSPITEYQNPPISSVDINPKNLGYEATKLLIEKLEGKPIESRHKILETKYIER